MNFHPSLPLSFRLSRHTCPRNRYSGAAVAVMRENRRARIVFAVLAITLPPAIAGLACLFN